MRIFSILILVAFVNCEKGAAQGINNLWLLGYDSIFSVQTGRSTINFASGAPVISWSTRPMNMGTSNAVISNSNGDLLFYTNGTYVANALDDTMLNGEELNPSSYTTSNYDHGLFIAQADLIIPVPGYSNKYYLFHSTIDDGCSICITYYLYFSVIDMTLDNGKGAVVSKNNVLLTNTLIPGLISSCKHANGRDWWIMCHQRSSNKFFKFLATPYGILGPYSQDIGVNRQLSGQVVFSPNGKLFAYYDLQDGLDVMDFDRCTGDFSNVIHVPINDGAGTRGAAFSSNSNLLYLSSMNYVYQFDMLSGNIPASKLTVAVWDSFYSPNPPFATNFYLSQLAPDGKIYINTGNGTDYLHVINYPDTLGIGCDVCQHCIQLPTYNSYTIPNYPNYFLGSDTGSAICDSLNSRAELLSRNDFVSLFPNPARDKLYLHLPPEVRSERSVRFFDILGAEWVVPISEMSEYVQADISLLRPSIYFLQITSKELSVTMRFIKN